MYIHIMYKIIDYRILLRMQLLITFDEYLFFSFLF